MVSMVADHGDHGGGFKYLGIFAGTLNSGTPIPISLPYHSHTSRDSYGNGMGVVWEWGSHYCRYLEFLLKYFIFSSLLGEDSHFDDHIFQMG